MHRKNILGQAYSASPLTEGGPAFLVYYSPAFLRQSVGKYSSSSNSSSSSSSSSSSISSNTSTCSCCIGVVNYCTTYCYYH